MVIIRHFDFRDLFLAPRAGLSGKKIWISTLGLLLAHIGYAVFTYLARLATGMTLGGIWTTQGLWPVPAFAQYAWPGWALQLLGFVFAGIVLLLTATAVSSLAYQQFKGDDFYSTGDAWSFARSRWIALILAPLVIAGLLLFMVTAGMLLGLVGKIPLVGPLVVALHMPLVVFFAMVAALSALVFFTHFALGPAIIGTTSGDAMDVLVQLYSCAWSQPWRFLTYQFLLKLIAVFSVHVLVIFVITGFWISRWVITPVMGDSFPQILQIGYDFARFRCPVTSTTCALARENLGLDLASRLPDLQQRCLDTLFAADLTGASGSVTVAGHIFGGVLFLIILAITGYFFATWFSGQTIIYLNLRKQKDGEDLLEYSEDDDWEPTGLDDDGNGDEAELPDEGAALPDNETGD